MNNKQKILSSYQLFFPYRLLHQKKRSIHVAFNYLIPNPPPNPPYILQIREKLLSPNQSLFPYAKIPFWGKYCFCYSSPYIEIVQLEVESVLKTLLLYCWALRC